MDPQPPPCPKPERHQTWPHHRKTINVGKKRELVQCPKCEATINSMNVQPGSIVVSWIRMFEHPKHQKDPYN
eukprot:780973-Rhodomonas_salina.1